MSIFEKHFGMKHEDSDSFVGMNVSILNDATLSLSPMLDEDKWKLQHFRISVAIFQRSAVNLTPDALWSEF